MQPDRAFRHLPPGRHPWLPREGAVVYPRLRSVPTRRDRLMAWIRDDEPMGIGAAIVIAIAGGLACWAAIVAASIQAGAL